MPTPPRIPNRRMDQVLNPWDAQLAAEAADQTHEEEEKAEEVDGARVGAAERNSWLCGSSPGGWEGGQGEGGGERRRRRRK